MCPKGNNENVTKQLEQVGAKTKKRKNSIMKTLGRIFLIFCTCGLWLLVGRSNGKEKTTFQNKKTAICQQCGYSWTVKE